MQMLQVAGDVMEGADYGAVANQQWLEVAKEYIEGASPSCP